MKEIEADMALLPPKVDNLTEKMRAKMTKLCFQKKANWRKEVTCQYIFLQTKITYGTNVGKNKLETRGKTPVENF